MFDCQVKQIKTFTFAIAIAAEIASVGLHAAEPTVDYARDIRPILADACFACHGPDEAHREADLRLDQPGSTAIKAGDPGTSELVARALNADMPYDQFLLKQLAGDLLPGATQDDRVATGFMRNSMINEEGGVDPEQFRMEALFDRMDAIGKSMLGLTIQCAQCHSHKYDPISHKDYYGLLAFINNCDEACITVFTPEEETARQATLDQVNQIVRDALDKDGDWFSRMNQWEANAMQAKSSDWEAIDIAFIAESIGGQKFLRQDDSSYIAAGYAPTKFHPTGDVVVDSLGRITAVKVEMMNDPNLPHAGPGRSVDGTWALSEIELQLPKIDDSGNETWHKVQWKAATATIDLPQSTLGDQFNDKSKSDRLLGPVQFAIDGNFNTAWHGDHGPGRRNDPQTAMFVLAEPIEAEPIDRKAHPIRFRIKLSQNHGGWNSDDNQTHNLGRFRVSVTDDPSPAIKPWPPSVMDAISIPIGERDNLQALQSIQAFIRQDHLLKDVAGAIDRAWENHPAGTSQLVLSQRETPRQTRRLERGDFLSPQELITPAIPPLLDHSQDNPASNPVNDQPESPSRLDFARWVASPGSPTTARSIVNRIWQEYFSVGITATSDDLGMQGEPPVYGELLDFLAVDFVENGWSLKHLHRQIVMSSTYQQDSSLTPQQFDSDPQNRLLARGPRLRVPAEMVRDIALAASGLMNPTVGGPPVYPPAPEFLFMPPASYGPKTWSTSDGGDRYRRALYTFRFRSVPYPVLEAFDAPNGDVSCIRRSTSNTPLQALVMLNEPMFLECARELAKHAKRFAETHHDDEAIGNVFASCTSRFPTSDELGVLADLLNQQRARFSKELDTAKKLAAVDSDQASELAAWTVVCRVILNLDETITKP